MTHEQEAIEQSMLAEQVYLDIVRGRHLKWAAAADDPEIKRLHTEIADLLQQTRDEYYSLFTASHAPAPAGCIH
jgi:hypothetical protein